MELMSKNVTDLSKLEDVLVLEKNSETQWQLSI